MTDEGKRKFNEAVAKSKRWREIKTGAGMVAGLIVIVLFWYMYAFGTGTESCFSAYAQGHYGEGRAAVEQFKDECSDLTKDQAISEIISITESPETSELVNDIQLYW